jgi:hypothetical protein
MEWKAAMESDETEPPYAKQKDRYINDVESNYTFVVGPAGFELFWETKTF